MTTWTFDISTTISLSLSMVQLHTLSPSRVNTNTLNTVICSVHVFTGTFYSSICVVLRLTTIVSVTSIILCIHVLYKKYQYVKIYTIWFLLVVCGMMLVCQNINISNDTVYKYCTVCTMHVHKSNINISTIQYLPYIYTGKILNWLVLESLLSIQIM